ncbi:MAG TPA: carbohydrate-binding domain-containing protein [Candidatus Bathyarchaeia archaeon]
MNKADHEDPADYTWDSSTIVDITLSGNSITVNPAVNATVAGSKVTITSAGNYRISGSLTDGQVIVNSTKGTVRLILNGVNIYCSNGPPIYIIDDKKTIIVLQAGTTNSVTDGTSYVLEAGTDEPNAAIFSKKDLTIYGTGTLNVDANYNDAISSKDGIIIKSGTITATSVDDGIRGKDYLIVKDGNINLNVGGDGLKSDDDNVTMGYVSIENGVINIVSTHDAISASTDLLIANGDFTLTTGGGSSAFISASDTAKGLKGSVCIIIDNGDFNINSADDTINTNGNITVNGGSFMLSTGDDGFHADTYLIINGGDISITKSFEGIEASVITINNGNIRINSSDDGINIAGGTDGAPADPFAPPAEGQWLHIKGGYIVVNAEADGIDTNGYMDMSGGVVIINGPTDNFNAAIDYGSGTFKITGGTIIAVGSSGMAQGPSAISTQYSVLVNLNSPQTPRLINLQKASGEVVFTFSPTKSFQSIVFSSPQLATGSYNLYLGGSSTGTATNGLYTGGTYTPGTKTLSPFTISTIVTTIGGGGGFFWP